MFCLTFYNMYGIICYIFKENSQKLIITIQVLTFLEKQVLYIISE